MVVTLSTCIMREGSLLLGHWSTKTSDEGGRLLLNGGGLVIQGLLPRPRRGEGRVEKPMTASHETACIPSQATQHSYNDILSQPECLTLSIGDSGYRHYKFSWMRLNCQYAF